MDYVNQAKPMNTKDMPTTGRRTDEATLPAGEGADIHRGPYPLAFAPSRRKEFPAKMRVFHAAENQR